MQQGVFMPLRKTGELTEFVRALRRRARQVRQRAFHDERLRDFANYLDGHAAVLEAVPRGSPAAQSPGPAIATTVGIAP